MYTSNAWTHVVVVDYFILERVLPAETQFTPLRGFIGEYVKLSFIFNEG